MNSQPNVPASPPLFIEPSLENELNDLDLYFYMPGERRKCTNQASKKSNKKAKIENGKTSGIFVGYAKLPSEMKEVQREEKKIFTKKECIDEVASVESMKEVERKLWLTHYDMLDMRDDGFARKWQFKAKCKSRRPYQQLPSVDISLFLLQF